MGINLIFICRTCTVWQKKNNGWYLRTVSSAPLLLLHCTLCGGCHGGSYNVFWPRWWITTKLHWHMVLLAVWTHSDKKESQTENKGLVKEILLSQLTWISGRFSKWTHELMDRETHWIQHRHQESTCNEHLGLFSLGKRVRKINHQSLLSRVLIICRPVPLHTTRSTALARLHSPATQLVKQVIPPATLELIPPPEWQSDALVTSRTHPSPPELCLWLTPSLETPALPARCHQDCTCW